MKNFIKTLVREGRGFAFLHQTFQWENMKRLKAGVFDDPQIRKLISFDDALNPVKLFAWPFLKSVIENFLGNYRSFQYQKVFGGEFPTTWFVHVSVHFLRSHQNYFLENCGDFIEEQGERFHHDISVMKKRYQGRWDVNFLTDYC